jgi:diguanylate cyclase
MEAPRSAAQRAEQAPAQLAKAALRRLASEKLEPTPENFALAYRQEAGQGAAAADEASALRVLERIASQFVEADVAQALARDAAQGRWHEAEQRVEAARASDGAALAALIDHLQRGLERSSKSWTAARKKESVQRVLASSRGDARRLRQRLSQLVASWDDAAAVPAGDDQGVAADAAPAAGGAAADAAGTSSAGGHGRDAMASLTPQTTISAAIAAPAAPPLASLAPAAEGSAPPWGRVVDSLAGTLGVAFPPPPGEGPAFAAALASLSGRIVDQGASEPLAGELEHWSQAARQLLAHRHHLVDQLGSLCQELTSSLTELAEDDSWARGQCEAMRGALADGLSARGVRSVGELLHDTRARQQQLRAERTRAREALKTMINRMLSELGTLGTQTGRFHESVGRYADTIERADSLEGLAGVVREMVEESRTVQSLVQQTQARLQGEHDRASELAARVRELESELVRLSDEVATDQLTQVANRRGLAAAFEIERGRVQRGGRLAVGLLDIDNFKRLNDELGHAAGDEALKALAATVTRTLRPGDMVARYGGEEFVVLLPDTPVDEGQQILTRLQRSLTGGLFMHESKQVFVTFSAGVTAYRDGEAIDAALERADQALYEAKRTGKNRTCIG